METKKLFKRNRGCENVDLHSFKQQLKCLFVSRCIMIISRSYQIIIWRSNFYLKYLLWIHIVFLSIEKLYQYIFEIGSEVNIQIVIPTKIPVVDKLRYVLIHLYNYGAKRKLRRKKIESTTNFHSKCAWITNIDQWANVILPLFLLPLLN